MRGQRRYKQSVYEHSSVSARTEKWIRRRKDLARVGVVGGGARVGWGEDGWSGCGAR